MKYQDGDATKVFSEAVPNCEITEAKGYKHQEISSLIEDLLSPSVGLSSPNTWKKYLSAGEHLYQKASDMDSKINCFENCIHRPYFHIKLLDGVQLENWHRYLDFIEMQGDFDWTVKLYERCLIPCANYPEFWIRYVEFVEAKGGREISNLVLVRATEIYLKRVPGIHLFCARFKEQIGDIFGARAAFLQCSSDLELDFIENITRKANLEKRLGNVEAASIIYEKALDMAKEKQNSHTLGILYAHFSQFKYVVTASIDAARDILIKGIQHLPHCKLLLERLVHFEMMHGGPRKIDILDSIIAQATAPRIDVTQGLSSNDREDISKLFLEFVDFCGSIHEIKKAWDRHRKLFPYQMRPTSSYQDMTLKNNSLVRAKTEGRDNLTSLPKHASGDNSTQCLNHHSSVKNTSLQKTTDIQSDWAVGEQSKQDETNNGTDEKLQQVQTAIVVHEQSRLDAAEQHTGSDDSVHEDNIGPQALQTAESAEATKQVQIQRDHEPKDDLIPPALETLSINSLENEIQQSIPTLSLDCKAPGETSVSNVNRPQDGGDTSEISLIPNLMCKQPETPPKLHSQQENGHLHMESDPSSQIQIQTQAHANSQQMVHSAVDGGNWHQMNYTGQGQRDPTSHGYAQAQQLQQWQASPRPQYPTAGMQSHMLTGQGYPCQPQPWQNLRAPQANQAPNQYQVATGHVYPTGTHVWPAQNVQPQTFASVPQSQLSAQSVSHPQAQVYQYPYQSSQQHSTMQSSNQGFTPQTWDYYQQHQHQLQQQQLHQQQLQQPYQQLQQQQLQPQQQAQPQQQIQLQQPVQQQVQPQQQIKPQQQLPPQQQPPQEQLQLQQHQQFQQQQLQYHQQQQQIQMWNYNYYAQQALPVQYYPSSQYGQENGQQAIVSEGPVASQHNGELSGHVDPHPQQQAPSSQ